VLNAIDSASAARVIEVDGIHPKEREIKKLKKAQPLTSNRQDFEDALNANSGLKRE
jgi:gluconate kinase